MDIDTLGPDSCARSFSSVWSSRVSKDDLGGVMGEDDTLECISVLFGGENDNDKVDIYNNTSRETDNSNNTISNVSNRNGDAVPNKDALDTRGNNIGAVAATAAVVGVRSKVDLAKEEYEIILDNCEQQTIDNDTLTRDYNYDDDDEGEEEFDTSTLKNLEMANNDMADMNTFVDDTTTIHDDDDDDDTLQNLDKADKFLDSLSLADNNTSTLLEGSSKNRVNTSSNSSSSHHPHSISIVMPSMMISSNPSKNSLAYSSSKSDTTKSNNTFTANFKNNNIAVYNNSDVSGNGAEATLLDEKNMNPTTTAARSLSSKVSTPKNNRRNAQSPSHRNNYRQRPTYRTISSNQQQHQQQRTIPFDVTISSSSSTSNNNADNTATLKLANSSTNEKQYQQQEQNVDCKNGSCCAATYKLFHGLPLIVRCIIIIAILAMLGSIAFLGLASMQKNNNNASNAAAATSASNVGSGGGSGGQKPQNNNGQNPNGSTFNQKPANNNNGNGATPPMHPAPSTSNTAVAVRGGGGGIAATISSPLFAIPPKRQLNEDLRMNSYNLRSSNNNENNNTVIGVYYYPWYTSTNNFHGKGQYLRSKLNPDPQVPFLGEYDSSNDSVIEQHVQWSVYSNIQMWAVSWWGPQSLEDVTLRDGVAPYLLRRRLNYFRVMAKYEEHVDQTTKKTKKTNRKRRLRATTDSPSNDHDGQTAKMSSSTTSDDENHLLASTATPTIQFAIHYETANRMKLFRNITLDKIESDMDYIATTYFHQEHYYRINGKPVIIMYLARCLAKQKKTLLSTVIQLMRMTAKKHGYDDIFIVGDMAFGRLLVSKDIIDGLKHLDAITNYDVYGSILAVRKEDEAFLSSDENISRHYATKQGATAYHQSQEEWRTFAQSTNCGFIPTISPGFNDRAVRLQVNHTAMSRKLNSREDAFGTLFRQLLKSAILQKDKRVDNLIMINSWNEWHEDTQIEPCVLKGISDQFKSSGGGIEDTSNNIYTQGVEYEAYGMRYLDILKEETSSLDTKPCQNCQISSISTK